MNEIRWFAVPSGVVQDEHRVVTHGRLCVLVSPRLDAAPTVAASLMNDWPARLSGLRLAVESRSTVTGVPHPVDRKLLPGADSTLWNEFFGPARNVRVDAPVLPVYTTPHVARTSAHAGNVASGYSTTAQKIAGPGGPSSPEAEQALTSTIAQFRDALPPTPEQVAGDEMTVPDFHRFLAMLREHPTVLRALGLVFELLLPAQDLDRPGAEPPRIRVTSPDLETISPWTKYHFDGKSFLPAPGVQVRDGRVDLSGAAFLEQAGDQPPEWALTSFDIDSALRRLQQAATNPRRTDGAATDAATAAESTDHNGLPPLRSAGLVLLHGDRSGALRRRADQARTRAEGDLRHHELDADDLVLGYRIDIKRQGSPWRSLHERTATYHVNEKLIASGVNEENHLKPFAAVRHGSGDLQSDEVVARWNGWSLAVPPPDLLPTPGRATGRRPAAMPFHFQWRFDLPDAGLPKLRFGETYQMRIRVADAAGGGLTLGEPVADEGATDRITYLRYEPVPPPRVETASRSGPGSSLLTMVIRSDPAAGLDVAAFAAGHAGVGVTDERTLVVPTIAMELAEQHGMLDGPDDEATYHLALRALLTGRSDVTDFDGPTGLPDPTSGGVLARALATPGGLATELSDDRNWTGEWPSPTGKSITARSGSGSHETISWTDDDHLEVALPPAAEAVMQLSSFITPEKLGHFEIKHWLRDFSGRAASSGRHPMATPSVTLRCIHAVRAPLQSVRGSVMARSRVRGQTVAELQSLLDVHTASTGHVDVAASWKEWQDDPALAAPVQLDVPSRYLQSLTIERGQAVFSDIRHELGDTKHRRIDYSATAVSRFRRYFADTEEATSFLRSGPLTTLDILSTDQPVPPMVEATVPAFTWTGREQRPGADPIVRERKGNLVRIELARPWFVTGDDERLGVLVAANPGSVPEVERPYLSWAGRDPILDTVAPTRFLGAEQFSGLAGEGPQPVTLIEAGLSATARLLPFEVHFASGRWCADIGIDVDPSTAYSPMIQLAVVRYQRHSVQGLERSTIVQTDIVNLLPDRTLTVERDAGNVRVLLDGPHPIGSRPNRVEVVLESSSAEVASPLTALAATTPGVATWERVPGGGVTGAIGAHLPTLAIPRDQRRYRVLVRELESIGADPASAASAFRDLSFRTVFADHIDLD